MTNVRKVISAKIAGWIEDRRQHAVDLARRLVRIPSVNNPPTGEEAEYQAFFARLLRERGAHVDVYEPDEVPGLASHPAFMGGRSYKGRPNVCGRFPGTGGGRSLMFSGHADTVYVGKEKWTYEPFAGIVDGGRLYGRGAYDMKGGMAAALCAVDCLRDLGLALRGDVFIESVVDEEHGGANGTLAGRLRGSNADMAVVPEPTNLRICPAHLGGGIWKARFAGKSGIGFAGETLVSALEAAVAFARALQSFKRHLNERFEPPEWWKRTGRTLEVTMLSIVSGDIERPYQEKVPPTAELDFWIEGYPGMTGEQLLTMLRDYIGGRLAEYPELVQCPPDIVATIRFLSASVMPSDEKTELFLRIVRETGRAALGDELAPEQGAPFACDGFMFNLHSPTPALILGPSGANAHAPDEYLDLDSYFRLIRWYAEMMIDWCGLADRRESV